MVTLLFFIFESPQLMAFADESLSQRGGSRKFDCLYFSHKVPVVVIVAVIVAKHASVIRGTSSQVYVSKTVGKQITFLYTNKPCSFRRAPFLFPLSRCVSLVL